MRAHPHQQFAPFILCLTLLAGCGGDERSEERERPAEVESTAGSPDSIGSTTDPASEAPISAPPEAPAADGPCGGRLGVDIPAVEIPAVESEPVVVPDQELAGETVPGFTVPGVDIPAQRVPVQCAVEEPAPAGCLGRVTIPATQIPAVEIPAATIPGVSVAGESQPAETQPAVSGDPVVGEQVVSEQVCAQKVRAGEYRPSVYRASAYRASAYRASVYRPSVYRPSICIDGDCIPGVTVPSVTAPGVTVRGVTVPGETLEGKTLPEIDSRCVRVLASSKRAAYSVCADVLFAFNRADIRPRAAAALRQVARSIAQRFPRASIRVEGHTDARGDAAYNQRLSLRRAEAVRRWLVDGANVAAGRVAVRGFGETSPVAPNSRPDGSDDPRGRRRNRRVVIGVEQP